MDNAFVISLRSEVLDLADAPPNVVGGVLFLKNGVSADINDLITARVFGERAIACGGECCLLSAKPVGEAGLDDVLRYVSEVCACLHNVVCDCLHDGRVGAIYSFMIESVASRNDCTHGELVFQRN